MAIMMFVPIFIGTGFAILISLVAGFFVPGPDKALHRTMVGTAAVMCWLMWLLAYMSQMYYLAVPERNNQTAGGSGL